MQNRFKKLYRALSPNSLLSGFTSTLFMFTREKLTYYVSFSLVNIKRVLVNPESREKGGANKRKVG